MENLAYRSPIGYLILSAEDNQLKEIEYADKKSAGNSKNSILAETARQLDEYFNGSRTEFELPLAPSGTDFQEQVWHELQKIPFGTTLSYGELAESLGDSKSVRAVAGANGKNPIPVIIPCHRVIGGNGKLTGYSGGIEKKRWLLQHEGALLI